MSGTVGIDSSPLGPFMVMTPSPMVAVTPAGIATGFLPMRLISEYLRQHLAADILFARFSVGQNTAGGGYDGDAKAVAHNRQFLGTRIDAAARLGHARDMLDRGLALDILQLDAQALVTAQQLFAISADIAFALQHIEN